MREFSICLLFLHFEIVIYATIFAVLWRLVYLWWVIYRVFSVRFSNSRICDCRRARMSKVSRESLAESVGEILKAAKEKPRKFRQTVELQIALKNYDPQKDKRFSGSVRCDPHPGS